MTANVCSSLSLGAAARCLEGALELAPDLLGLQEWRWPRFSLLTSSGELRLAGTPVRLPARRAAGGQRMTWVASPWGDCVLGLRADRYTLLRHRQVRLAWPWLADPGTRRSRLLPPRWASVVEALDLCSRERLGVIGFHLVPGSQAAGRYRSDRPRTTSQHRAEVAALGRIVTELAARCSAVWALGDSNFHDLRLPGLSSAWEGVPGSPGTLGSYRRIDDVFGTGSATLLETYVTASDHRMVLVERVAAAERV